MKGDGGAERTVGLGDTCEQKEAGEEMHLGWRESVRG
jgi:hypothetical protein